MATIHNTKRKRRKVITVEHNGSSESFDENDHRVIMDVIKRFAVCIENYRYLKRDLASVRDDDKDQRVYRMVTPSTLGYLPDSILELDALEILDLSSSHDLKEIPRWIDKLKKIKEIHLPSCFRTEGGQSPLVIPSEFWNMTQLKVFHDNCYRTTLPGSISNFANLRELWLTVATLPKEIGTLSRLEILGLSSLEMKNLPSYIGNLSNLKQLYINYSECLHTLPSSIGKLTNLETLELDECGIKSLPMSIGDLTNLKVLSLTESSIESLPPSIGNLRNLKELYLEETPHLKRLPHEIKNLKNLTYLNIFCSKIVSDKTCSLGFCELQKNLLNLKNLEFLKITGDLFETHLFDTLVLELANGLPSLMYFDYRLSHRNSRREDGIYYAIRRRIKSNNARRRLCRSRAPGQEPKLPIISVWPLILEKPRRAFKVDGNCYIFNHKSDSDAIFQLLAEYGPKILENRRARNIAL